MSLNEDWCILYPKTYGYNDRTKTGFSQNQKAFIESVASIIRSRPHTSTPQWTDAEVMKEIQDAFDLGVAAAESTIDMQKHDTSIRNATLDTLDLECQEIKSRIESSAMGSPLSERERGRIIGVLDVRIKIESLRSTPTTKESGE